MNLYPKCYDIALIQILILCGNFYSLFGKCVVCDTGQVYDDSQAFEEEIVRRRKLVQSHLLQTANEQSDWIATNHKAFGGHETIPIQKVSSSSSEFINDPVRIEVSSVGSNEEMLKEQPRKEGQVYDDSQAFEEEIVRRRKLVQPHLLQTANEQSDWIATYHKAFGGHETIPIQKVSSSSSEFINDPVHIEVSSVGSNEEMLKEQPRKEGRTHSQKLNFDNKRQETLLDHSVKSMASESLPVDPEIKRRLKMVEDSMPMLKNFEMGIEIHHIESSIRVSKASSSDYRRTKSIDDVVEIKRHSEEYISANKFVNSPTLKPTEMNKYRTESGHSISDSDKRDKDFMLRENTVLSKFKRESIDSNAEQSIKTGKWISQTYVSSKIQLNPKNIYHCSVGNMKANFLNIIKELTDLKAIEPNMFNVLPHKKISSNKNHEVNYPIFKTENTDQAKFKKNDDLGLPEELSTISNKFNVKQAQVKAFTSSLDKGKENWKETFLFSHKETNLDEHFKYEPVVVDSTHFPVNLNEVNKNITVKPVKIQERPYFHRWLKKLLNKLIGHSYTDHVYIVFSFTPDALNELQMLSTMEKYEINFAEKFISDLITNATVSYSNNINSFHASFSSVHFYIIACILIFVLLYFALMYYRRIAFIFVFFASCIALNGYKMYQQKIAEKHAILSGSSSAYCESLLNRETGIFAQIKEFFRYSLYDDHCKKYFEALMIDPISELSLSIVISDLVSSSFFQLFQPIGRVLNTLVKDLSRDLSFFQGIYLIVVLIFISAILLSVILIYNRYKLNFPFFMGSLEPTSQLRGSRVEDIALEPKIKGSLQMKEKLAKSITKMSPLKPLFLKTNAMPFTHHTGLCNLSLKTFQNDPPTKISQSLKRRSSC